MANSSAKTTADPLSEMRDKGAEAVASLSETGAEVARESLDAVSHLAEEGQQRALELRDQALERGSVLMEDLSAVFDASKEFARRNPALVVGAAAVAGYALSRMLRAEADNQSHAQSGNRTAGAQGKSSGKSSTSKSSSGGSNKTSSRAKQNSSD